MVKFTKNVPFNLSTAQKRRPAAAGPPKRKFLLTESGRYSSVASVYSPKLYSVMYSVGLRFVFPSR